jgi:hypothetical protein
MQQNRPWKVVTVRRHREEDPDAALDRHFAAHPEDRGADVVIFHFFDDEEMTEEVPRRLGPFVACPSGFGHRGIKQV